MSRPFTWCHEKGKGVNMSELEAMLLDYDNKELIISSDKLAELTGVQHRSLTKQIN